MARKEHPLHPDEACGRIGLVPKPGEPESAKYDRRKALKGLTAYAGNYKGYRYDAAEVEALAARTIKQVKRAA